MSLNVPDTEEEVPDKNTGAFSVPLNGVSKVSNTKKRMKNFMFRAEML